MGVEFLLDDGPCGSAGRFDEDALATCSWLSAYSRAPANGCACASLRGGPPVDGGAIETTGSLIASAACSLCKGVNGVGCPEPWGSETTCVRTPSVGGSCMLFDINLSALGRTARQDALKRVTSILKNRQPDSTNRQKDGIGIGTK